MRRTLFRAVVVWLGFGALMVTQACSDDRTGARQTLNPTTPPKEPMMTTSEDDRPTRSSSRIRAPELAPVIHAGVRYEQLKAASSEGLPPGGYVVATEMASGKRLWTAKVYETVVDPNRETDVQMVHLRSLTLSPGGDYLLLEDEKSRRYRIGLQDGAVQSQP